MLAKPEKTKHPKEWLASQAARGRLKRRRAGLDRHWITLSCFPDKKPSREERRDVGVVKPLHLADKVMGLQAPGVPRDWEYRPPSWQAPRPI